MRKAFRITLGVVLVLLGLLGGLIPILPGFVLGIPGLIILAEYFPAARRLLDWLKSKYDAAREAATATQKSKAQNTGSETPPPTV